MQNGHTANFSALVLGASGLVGNEVLRQLLGDATCTKVTALVRRKLAMEHSKLEQVVVDMERLQNCPQFKEADQVFCCLGTTIKKAGSQEAFRRVDYEMPMAAGRTSQVRAKKFLLVSSVGADPSASVFYSRVKGELEADLAALNFAELHIFRPSLLLGDREERRLGENVAIKIFSRIGFLFVGPLRKYRPISAGDVAAAMLRVAKQAPSPGNHIHESDGL